ncbi:hypothetical protein AKJ09_07599 [Labilithrix luteola]|uniref:PEGA domain-containing protein n=1 Tax=Labilithrix luteola TaxID=1391654 RepID=A0A0K1Q522_9BACT|nr:hypothetical protein [Labilithrix luteola]AKV00936.1 hypothetical protein AKJ09_07599 [Labilithrix luteola]
MRVIVASMLLKVAASVAVVAAISCPSVAFADAPKDNSKETAKRLFEEGLDLEKRGEFMNALQKYKEAEQIAVTAGLRFHKAYCLEMNGKSSQALEEYEAADKLATETGKTDVHNAVIARLDPLRVRVPRLTLHVDAHASKPDVQLDGHAVSAAALDGKPFFLDPGEHVIEARASGRQPFRQSINIAEGKNHSVDVVLTPIASSVTTDEAPPEGSKRRSLALPILTTAGTVAFAAAGVVTFVLAGSAQSDAEKSCSGGCDDERSNVRTLDAVALGSFIGAAALGVTSIVLWTSSGRRETANAPSTRLFASPRAVGIEGSF